MILTRELIRETLRSCYMYSPNAEELLFATAAHESHLGKYTSQIGGGPAKGPYQTEMPAFDDALSYLEESKNKIFYGPCKKITSGKEFKDLEEDYVFATIICRLFYARIGVALPDKDSIESIAQYWKKYYNTEKGKGTISSFTHDYYRFANPEKTIE